MDDKLKMKFRSDFRFNEKTKEMMRWIMHNFPGRFESESHMIRCAILLLGNELKTEVQNVKQSE